MKKFLTPAIIAPEKIMIRQILRVVSGILELTSQSQRTVVMIEQRLNVRNLVMVKLG